MSRVKFLSPPLGAQQAVRLWKKYGSRGLVSEALFRVAHGLASSQANTLFVHPRTLRLERERAGRKWEEKERALELKNADLLAENKRIGQELEEQNQKSHLFLRELKETRRQIKVLRKDLKDTQREARASIRQLRSLRASPLDFYPSAALPREICPCCYATEPLLSSYPHCNTARFAPLLTCWCQECGFGWTPSLPFVLDEYYSQEYATANRGDRDEEPQAYFEKLNLPLSDMPPKMARYVGRAKEQLQRISAYFSGDYSLLDYGSGPGYALYLSGLSNCDAIEPDAKSEKYLNHIGARRVELTELEDDAYDVILSSHSIEHLPVEKLYETLAHLRRALKKAGILYVEVPNAALTDAFLPGNPEPHTLFFSLYSLQELLRRNGFRILDAFARTTRSGQLLERALQHRADLNPLPLADGLTVIAAPDGFVETQPLPARPLVHHAQPRDGSVSS